MAHMACVINTFDFQNMIISDRKMEMYFKQKYAHPNHLKAPLRTPKFFVWNFLKNSILSI